MLYVRMLYMRPYMCVCHHIQQWQDAAYAVVHEETHIQKYVRAHIE